MKKLTSKEKIFNAINHKEGDIPIDIGSMPTTGLHVKLIDDLREYYGLEKRPTIVLEPYQMLGHIEDDLREAMGIDTKPLWGRGSMLGIPMDGKLKEWESPWGQTVLVPEKFNTTSKDGNIYIYAEGDMNYPPTAVMPTESSFFDTIIYQDEIDDDNLEITDNLVEFGPISDRDIAFLKDQKQKLGNSNYFICGNLGGTALGDIALVPGPMLKVKKGIRDIEEWYISTLTRQDYIHQIFEKQVDIGLKNLKTMHDILGDSVQIAYLCGNDFGTQLAQFCSKETFDSLYAPYYKQINDWIHTNTNWRTFKHSCGAVEPLIENFIDVGFDVLNPVQWTAVDMDRISLKKKYGKNLVFWGGGIDTQKTLPFGTPEEVRKEVLETCEIFGKDGGFVFNTIHNILANTPVENLVAMIDAVHEFNGKS